MSNNLPNQVLPPPPGLERIPLVENQRSPGWITDKVAGIIEAKTPAWWWWAFIPSLFLTLLLLTMLTYLISSGVGVWGLNHPVMWGWAIVNFVWWIGIGHAGTLISAVLFLLRQKWRTSINRAAEAMTIFAVMCAGIYPLVHIGRVWYGWWLFPIPNSNGIWPQFRSPLMWDVFAVSTYFTVSLLFWYVGLIPDLAILRDRSKTRARQFFYGLFALGWTGSNRHWSNYEKAYLILAGLATPLVLSVHSTVSMDFSVSQLPGWHTTIFPPYFVAGAIYSGFGMVLTLMVPLRKMLKLEEIVTMRHIDLMCKVTLDLLAPAVRQILVWRLGDAGVQCDGAAAFLVQEMPTEPGDRLHHLHPGQHRHVVRALRDCGRLALPGLCAVQLGLLQADLGGCLHLPGHLRPVLHAVPAVSEIPAADRHVGGQGHHAAGGSASPAGRGQIKGGPAP